MESGEKKHRKNSENKIKPSKESTLIALNPKEDEFKNEKLLKLQAESTLAQLWTRTPEKNEMLIRQKEAIRLGENSREKLEIDSGPDENTILSLDATPTHTITDIFTDDCEIALQIPEPTQDISSSNKLYRNYEKCNSNMRRPYQQSEKTQKTFDLDDSNHQINKEIPIKPPKLLEIHKRVPQKKETTVDDTYFLLKEEKTNKSSSMNSEQRRPTDDNENTCPEHVRPLIVVLWCAAYCLASALQHFYYHYL